MIKIHENRSMNLKRDFGQLSKWPDLATTVQQNSVIVELFNNFTTFTTSGAGGKSLLSICYYSQLQKNAMIFELSNMVKLPQEKKYH